MQELRLVSATDDGAKLLLRSGDGSDFTLVLDERLRAAVRGDRVRMGQLEIAMDLSLRPRDIQARIGRDEGRDDRRVIGTDHPDGFRDFFGRAEHQVVQADSVDT